jgi:hypothetical protein
MVIGDGKPRPTRQAASRITGRGCQMSTIVINSTGTSARERLADYVRANGPIPTVRVSSAQAKGRAKRYCYWGAVRYAISLARDGSPKHIPLERASSDRRSRRLAQLDAERIAAQEGRVGVWFGIGKLSETQCEYVLSVLASQSE